MSKGPEAGRQIRLRDWQRWLLQSLLERRSDGRRRYRRALIGLPRKNGKSLLGSVLGLYSLVEGGIGAEVYSAAGDRQQARIVFDEARWQVQNSPELSRVLKVYRNVIEYPDTGGVYRVLSADGKLQQGLNPSTVIFDEVHIQPGDDLWDAMTLGSGARVDPLVVGITTAGFDLESLCGRLFQYGRKVAAGDVDDDTFGFFWWQAPDGCQVGDRAGWGAANPGLGDYLDPDDMASSAQQTPEPSFRRFRLNQWVRAEESWLPAGAWQACQGDARIPDGARVWVGVDVALYHDSTAVVVAWPRPDGKTAVQAEVWRPDGDKLDVGDVMQHIRELADRLDLAAVAYDPRFFDVPAGMLQDEGIPMLEVPQTPERMIPACGFAWEQIVAGLVVHDGDPTLEDHVLSAARRQSERGWSLSKGKSKRKIDACIAMVLALHMAAQQQQGESVYESRGLLVF